jgi:retron-type reverse transcriptase
MSKIHHNYIQSATLLSSTINLTPLQNTKLQALFISTFNSKVPKDFISQFFTTSPKTQSSIDTIYNELVSYIHHSASLSFGTVRQNLPHKQSKYYPTTPQSQNYSNLDIDRSIISLLNKSSKNKLSIKSLKPNTSITEEARSYYRNLFRSSIPNYILPLPPSIPTTFNPTFTTPFEICRHINTYPSYKSPGNDRISSRLIKILNQVDNTLHPHLNSNLPFILADLYNIFFRHSIFPTQWLIFNTTLIPKKKTGICYLKDLRPIGICNLFRLIFESILLIRIKPLIKLSPSQHGFQSHKSTLCNLSWLYDTQSSSTITLFTDYEKCFDTVEIKLALHKLHSRLFQSSHHPFHSLIYSSILALYLQTFTYIKINHQFSRLIKRTRCVPQGGILSPLLFNILIDDLPTTIESKLPLTLGASPVSLFADDFAARVLQENHLHELFKILVTWSDANYLAINPPKCGIINYSGPPLIYQQQQIPIVSSYKYLGILVTSDKLQFYNHILAKLAIGKQKLDLLIHSPYTVQWPPSSRLYAFRTYIRSIWEYTLPLAFTILSPQHKLAISSRGLTIINKACSWISMPLQLPTQLQKNMPFLRYALSIPTFLDRIDQLLASISFKPPLLPSSDLSHFTRALENNPILQEYKHFQLSHPTTSTTLPTFLKQLFFNRRKHQTTFKPHQPLIFNPQKTGLQIFTAKLPLSELQQITDWQFSMLPLTSHDIMIADALSHNQFKDAINLLGLHPP